ncbi:MAG: hypothetical protein VZR78_01395, partial [Candidatus Enteromonas sp.]|nr:hypothetical protein [Candidatus Enteromonas sp.]
MRKTTRTLLLLSSTFLIACGNPAGQNPVSSIVANSSAETPISSARDNHDSVSSLIESLTSSSTAPVTQSSSNTPAPSSSQSIPSSSSSGNKEESKTYSRVNSIDDLDLSKPVVICAAKDSGFVSLSSEKADDKKYHLAGNAVTMQGDKIVSSDAVTEWSIESSGDSYSFKIGDDYLQSYTQKKGNTTYYNICVGTDTRNSNLWDITIEEGEATLESSKGVFLEWYNNMFQGYGSAGSATIMYLFQSDVTGVTSGTWTWDTNYQAANQYVPTAI